MSHSYSKLNDNSGLIDADDSFHGEPSYIVADEDVFNTTNGNFNTNPTPPPTANKSTTNDSSRELNTSNIFHISFYRQFFDLDSDIFFEKVQRGLNPFSSEFASENDQETELYGFIWITGTLIFLMFVSSTGSNLLSEWIHSSKGEKYNYSFDLITTSIILFYGYNFLIPLCLYVFVNIKLKFPEPLHLTTIMSIYGYTNILWIPITLINIIIVVLINNDNHPVLLNTIEWIIVLGSGALTGLSNLKKLSAKIKHNCLLLNNDVQLANKQYWSIIICLSVAHAVFTVLVKTSYFGI